MSTIWSIIVNRIDGAAQVWKEWRSNLISTSTGAADAGAIPMLGPDGKIDPSMIPGGSGGGVTSLNTLVGDVVIAAGTGITITPSGQTLTLSSTATHEILVNGVVLPQEPKLEFVGGFTGTDDPINDITTIALTSVDGNSVTITSRKNTLSNLPTLNQGEFFYATDTGQLYMGTGTGAILIGPSSASGAPTVTALVDFGFSSGNEGDVARTTIPALWVTSSSLILCSSQAIATPDHDPEDAALENIQVWAENLVPGVGFDVIAIAPNNSWGRYAVQAVGF